jgi:histidinol phosphatase-like enzyme
MCPHAEDAGCACRKPAPGLIAAAADAFGLETHECAVIGGIGTDVEAAHAAGARSVLVPTAVTLASEIASAPAVARDLREAVLAVLETRA